MLVFRDVLEDAAHRLDAAVGSPEEALLQVPVGNNGTPLGPSPPPVTPPSTPSTTTTLPGTERESLCFRLFDPQLKKGPGFDPRPKSPGFGPQCPQTNAYPLLVKASAHWSS